MPYRATSGLHLAAQNGDVAALQRLLVYSPRRAHPYLRKIEAGGGWKKYERAHLRSLSATFVPKFPRLPAEIVPLIVQFWAHVGDY